MFSVKKSVLLGLLLAIAGLFGMTGQASAATGTITLTTPISNNTYINTMPLVYTLADTPGADTVKVVLTGATTTYTITMTDTTSGSKNTSLNLGNIMASANVASITPSVTGIPDGIYSVSMNYRNAAFEPPATSVTRTNVRIDQAAPIVQTLTPANNATGVSATPTLQLLFNEVTQKNTGNILIKKLSDDSTVETIAVSSGQVTGQNTTTISIAPSVTLEGGETYYVVVPPTAFRDTFNHAFAGFATSTGWRFTVLADTIINSDATSDNEVVPDTTDATLAPTGSSCGALTVLAFVLLGVGLIMFRRYKYHTTKS